MASSIWLSHRCWIIYSKNVKLLALCGLMGGYLLEKTLFGEGVLKDIGGKSIEQVMSRVEVVLRELLGSLRKVPSTNPTFS